MFNIILFIGFFNFQEEHLGSQPKYIEVYKATHTRQTHNPRRGSGSREAMVSEQSARFLVSIRQIFNYKIPYINATLLKIFFFLFVIYIRVIMRT